MKLSSILVLGLVTFMSSAPAFAQSFTFSLDTHSKAEERHRLEEQRRVQEEQCRLQEQRRLADERRREEMRREEGRREEAKRQLRLMMEQRNQDVAAQQLAADAAQNNYNTEIGAANSIRADIGIERGNMLNFDAKTANYSAKAQIMFDGCSTSADQEECLALAAAEKSLGDKYGALAQGSRDRIAQLDADLREHNRLAAHFAVERDEHLSRKIEFETELRGPKYVEVRPSFDGAGHVITPVEVRVRAE